jgi:hypothetical protein
MAPRTFDLLVALVIHRARALSKDELFTLVWSGSVVEEGNLAQQVHVLRHTLQAAGECIATLPRHGYRFVASVTEEPGSGPSPLGSVHCLVWDGRELPLSEGITVIGRANDADLQIPSPSLSRHHARIVVRGLEATIQDLGSRNGSWRGGQPIREATPLADGDQLTLGSASIVYHAVLPDATTID